jgi:hypothetical protein
MIITSQKVVPPFSNLQKIIMPERDLSEIFIKGLMPMLNDLILINKADQAASKATVPSSHQL